MGALGRWAIAGNAAVLLCSCLAFPFVASGQTLQGRFFTPKNTYLVGEPIFVTYELANTGRKPVWIDGRLGDPCFDQSPVTVENASPATRPRWKTALACAPAFTGGSCLSGEMEIKPRQTHSGRIYVNHYYQMDQPGIYEVSIDWNIPVARGPIPSDAAGTVELMGNVDIQVVQGTEPELESAFQPALKDLASADFESRWQTVQALTEQAQPFLEQTILDLSKNPGDVWAAIEGLYRINTPPARTRLADLSERGNDDGVRERAMQALAATGDTDYLPMFFRLARTLKGYEQVIALESAGLLGGDKAVSFLLSFLRSPDPTVRGAAVVGLAGTANRNAVGPLIQETQDPGANVRQSASFALTQLTHRSVSHGSPPAEADPASTFQIWLNWWLTQGRAATVYGPTECAEPTPIN